MNVLLNWLAPAGVQALFVSWAVQGALLGLCVLAALAVSGRVRKAFGFGWLCRQWLLMALLFLVPVQRLAQMLSATALEPLFIILRHGRSSAVTVTVPQQLTHPVSIGSGAAAQTVIPQTVPVQAAVLPSPLQWGTALWLCGLALVLAWNLTAYCVWRHRALRSASQPDAGWLCEGMTVLATPAVQGPVLAGMFRPVLLVPPGPAPAGAAYMLAHEQAHLRRHDVAFKLLLMLVCAVHWYNPAVWLLQSRASRDIEAACDAAVLQNQSNDYRAAYADALLEAVRQSCGPVLTSCFALNKQQLKARLAALWDTEPKQRGRLNLALVVYICLSLCLLVACQTQADSEPTEEELKSSALMLAMEPVQVPQDAEPEQLAILAAAQFVREPLVNNIRSDTEHIMGRYQDYPGMVSQLADPDGEIAEKLDSPTPLVDTPEGYKTIRECLAMPGYYLVKVSYTIYYTPETLYLGPQYSDGASRKYILVCVNGEQPACLDFAPPSSDDSAPTEPTQTSEAKALRLSTRQYLMLEHQTKALYRAGIGNFTSPKDWTDAELTRYLYYRSRDYLGDCDQMAANLMLTVDFTAENDWSSNARFLSMEWSGVEQTVWAQCSSEPWPEPQFIQYTANGDGTITAQTDRARYTFRVYNGGGIDWSARTYCIGGEAVS